MEPPVDYRTFWPVSQAPPLGPFQGPLNPPRNLRRALPGGMSA